MSEQRTIYCNLGKEAIASIMSRTFADLAIDGEPDDWSTITARVDGGSMTLNALTFQYVNDEYSNLHFKTCMFIWNLETVTNKDKERLNESLGHKKLIVGVVVEPDFATDERFTDTILDIAEQIGWPDSHRKFDLRLHRFHAC